MEKRERKTLSANKKFYVSGICGKNGTSKSFQRFFLTNPTKIWLKLVSVVIDNILYRDLSDSPFLGTI